jgi:Flp pilus assembly protein TadD
MGIARDQEDPKPAYLTTLGTALLNLRRHRDALKVFDKAVQLEPDDPGLWSNFGDALVEAGHVADALVCFGRAFQTDPRWRAIEDSRTFSELAAETAWQVRSIS